ncbi:MULTISPECIES: cytochrome c biogenesis CcdA family protein [Streptomyces]|uniref:cytochrome c biogenesis CcdA family protein n=1 Tax=Streptomyces TaxID=1883 RepID=UPI001E2C6BBB|nr:MULTISPECIES: cytochrome c biogenesis CcdA family protein [Streptomyces]UFQ16667.1 cytochrome c biogenesis CcdA family protein [Streptomyces huasconensis]WCL86268.1 cytochrome c biogenesis CcdA family protein [Streptomyces sp. JCM 35825]
MTADVGYFAAFLGGLLALVSPCSALLLPAFFAYSIDSTSRLVARTGIFYAGLATTLVPLGAAGSYAGRFFFGHRDQLVLVAGWLIIGLGALQVVGMGFASRRMAELSGRIRPTTAFSVYALGAVYGLAGFCAGPILGSVLTVAAVSGSPVYGGLLLAVYALGMAVPLFVLALLWERFELGRRGWLRGRAFRVGRFELHTTSLLSGLFFVALGTLFLVYDGTTALPGLLDVDDSFAVEQWAGGVGRAVPDAVLLVGVVVLVGGVLGVRGWRRRGETGPATEVGPEAETEVGPEAATEAASSESVSSASG